MFSVESSIPIQGSRRRRIRPSYDADSIKDQAPPRKRTRITSREYLPDDHKVKEEEPKSNTSTSIKSIKYDSTIILSKTSKYTISQSTNLPEKLKKHAEFKPFFTFKHKSSQIVIVTGDSILIWDSSPNQIPKSITLPIPVKSYQSIPLVSLITNSTKELALFVIYPDTGKLWYVEDINSIESLKLFDSRKQGIQEQLKKSSNELITQIIDTDLNGLVLLTTYGRLIHVILQDSYGNSKLTINYLPNHQSASFLTSIKSTITSGWNTKINNIISRKTTRKHIELIGLQENGTVKVWNLPNDSTSSALFSIDDYNIDDTVQDALFKTSITSKDQKVNVKYLDFCQLNTISHEIDQNAFVFHCLIVISLDIKSVEQKFVLEMMITSSNQSQASISRILPVSFPTTKSKEKLNIIFSSREETIIIIQDLNISIISWPLPMETIGEDSCQLVHYFQDCIQLNKSKASSILGFAKEENSKTTDSILLYTKSSGLLKLSPNVYNPKNLLRTLPLTKLEQQVFFGNILENPLLLNDFTLLNYSLEDIETASIQLSINILTTTSDFLPKSSSLIEQHLSLRMKLLQEMASFLMSSYPNLSRQTKWKLMFDLEKLSSARKIWHIYNNKLNKGFEGKDLLEEVIEIFLSKYKDDTEDSDRVRYWFVKHINLLEKLFPICFQYVKTNMKSSINDTKELLDIVKQLHELIISTLENSFDFRQRHLSLYGLDNEDIEDGLLLSGYEDLLPFWTSDSEMIKSISWIIDISKGIIIPILGKSKDSKKSVSQQYQQVRDLSTSMIQIIKISCKTYIEQYKWLMSQDNIELQNKGLDVKNTFENVLRKDQILSLYDMGQNKEALKLAEDLNDTSALVEISLLEFDHIKFLKQQNDEHNQKDEQIDQDLEEIELQIQHYFRKYGTSFSKPFYQNQLSNNRLGDLLIKDFGKKEERTQFLQSDRRFAKLSWINDTIENESLVKIGTSLMEVAKDNELNIWSKGIELSIAKLALRSIPGSREPSINQTLQGSENEPESQNKELTKELQEAIKANQLLQQNERQINLWKIQQKLYHHIKDSIIESIDDDGAIENVMMTFGKACSKRYKSLSHVLKLGFADLISHRTMASENLIDLLTLMDQIEGTKDENGFKNGEEIILALKVLDSSDFDSDVEDVYHKLIWKRCFVKDDWNSLNKTKDKSDKKIDEKLTNTSIFLTIKLGIEENNNTPTTVEEFLSSIPFPESLLGSGSESNFFNHRFPTDELRIPLAEDNKSDDKKLLTFIKSIDFQGFLQRMKDLAVESIDENAEIEMQKSIRYSEFIASNNLPAIGDLIQEDEYEEEDEVEGEEEEGTDSDDTQQDRRIEITLED